MDQITHSYSYSPYSSASTSSSSSTIRPPKQFKLTRPSYTDPLHSVQKPMIRKPITKPSIAPFPPTPSKVYKVTSSSFKAVVRMLTSTPEFQSPSATRRLKDIAPPPLTMSAIPKPSIFLKPPPPQPSDTNNNRFVTSNSPVMEYFGSLSPLGITSLSPARPCFDHFDAGIMSPFALNLSPSSLSWCSSLLLSPTNLSGFNIQSPIL